MEPVGGHNVAELQLYFVSHSQNGNNVFCSCRKKENVQSLLGQHLKKRKKCPKIVLHNSNDTTEGQPAVIEKLLFVLTFVQFCFLGS